MLDDLVDLDEKISVALNVFIRQKEWITKAYNKKVKLKAFKIGDYIWKVILPMKRKDTNLDKWSPNWEDSFQIIQVFSNDDYKVKELSLEGRPFF